MMPVHVHDLHGKWKEMQEVIRSHLHIHGVRIPVVPAAQHRQALLPLAHLQNVLQLGGSIFPRLWYPARNRAHAVMR